MHLQKPLCDLSIIIVTWNSLGEIDACLRSVFESKVNLEVIIVDNNSIDGTVDFVKKEWPQCKLIEAGGNLGFARANNIGIRVAQGRYILLLNPDTVILGDAIGMVLDEMDHHPRIGIAGCTLVDAKGNVQRSNFPFPTPAYDLHLLLSSFGDHESIPQDNGLTEVRGFLTGAFLMVRREALEEVGGLDERIFMYGEDVEWCYRMTRHGWGIGYCPQARVVHIGNVSGQKAFGAKRLEMVYRGIIYFQRKYFGQYYLLGWLIRNIALLARGVFWSFARLVSHGKYSKAWEGAWAGWRANLLALRVNASD